MNSLKSFLIILAILFALPWLALIVYPSIYLGSLEPVPYAEDEEEEGWFPAQSIDSVERGAEVYARNGCAYCHTQVVRPTYAGSDMWRPGWSGRGEEGFGRETTPYDYLGSDFAFLGVQRNGPDLSNVGWRVFSDRWHHEHLFDPRSKRPVSIMPAFRHLYQKRPVEGPVSLDAVAVVKEEGRAYEFVPSRDAKALVRYLQSMKKDAKLPQAVAQRIREGS